MVVRSVSVPYRFEAGRVGIVDEHHRCTALLITLGVSWVKDPTAEHAYDPEGPQALPEPLQHYSEVTEATDTILRTLVHSRSHPLR